MKQTREIKTNGASREFEIITIDHTAAVAATETGDHDFSGYGYECRKCDLPYWKYRITQQACNGE